MGEFLSALAGVLGAALTFLGLIVTTRSGNAVARGQREDRARQLDREAYALTSDELRKNMADLGKRMEASERREARMRGLIVTAIDHVRELRTTLRLNNIPAPTLPPSLSDAWFEFTDGGSNDNQP